MLHEYRRLIESTRQDPLHVEQMMERAQQVSPTGMWLIRFPHGDDMGTRPDYAVVHANLAVEAWRLGEALGRAICEREGAIAQQSHVGMVGVEATPCTRDGQPLQEKEAQ